MVSRFFIIIGKTAMDISVLLCWFAFVRVSLGHILRSSLDGSQDMHTFNSTS